MKKGILLMGGVAFLMGLSLGHGEEPSPLAPILGGISKATAYTVDGSGNLNSTFVYKLNLNLRADEEVCPPTPMPTERLNLQGIQGAFLDLIKKQIVLEIFNIKSQENHFEFIPFVNPVLSELSGLESSALLYSHDGGGELFLSSGESRIGSFKDISIGDQKVTAQAVTLFPRENRLCILAGKQFIPSGETGLIVVDSKSGAVHSSRYLEGAASGINGSSYITWISDDVVMHIKYLPKESDINIININSGQVLHWQDLLNRAGIVGAFILTPNIFLDKKRMVLSFQYRRSNGAPLIGMINLNDILRWIGSEK